VGIGGVHARLRPRREVLHGERREGGIDLERVDPAGGPDDVRSDRRAVAGAASELDERVARTELERREARGVRVQRGDGRVLVQRERAVVGGERDVLFANEALARNREQRVAIAVVGLASSVARRASRAMVSRSVSCARARRCAWGATSPRSPRQRWCMPRVRS
jgi:hypothetical protein